MEKEAQAAERSGPSVGLPRLVFFGTPTFACPSLARLVAEGADIALVVTQPDRPRGRGLQTVAGPVKQLAERYGLTVIQPESIRPPQVIERIQSVGAECLVLIAYGRLLPPQLVTGFHLGAVNVHPSLLPRHRGAAPIQRSLLAGDAVTGVSIMLMDQGMDSGPLLAQTEIPVAATETWGSLHDRLAEVGAELLWRTLIGWHAGAIQPRAQNHELAVMAPPIAKPELKISWDRPAQRVVDQVRAFDPEPGAYCLHRNQRIKCFQAQTLPWQAGAAPGEVLGVSDQGLVVAAASGSALAIGELQLAGKRRQPALALVRGYRLEAGALLD